MQMLILLCLVFYVLDDNDYIFLSIHLLVLVYLSVPLDNLLKKLYLLYRLDSPPFIQSKIYNITSLVELIKSVLKIESIITIPIR